MLRLCRKGLHNYEASRSRCPECLSQWQKSEKGKARKIRFWKCHPNYDSLLAKRNGYRAQKAYRQRHPDRILARNKAYYQKTKGSPQRRYQQQLKDAFFRVYGERCLGPIGSDDCVHGGVIDRDLLTIAHLNGDGGEHRRRLNTRGNLIVMIDLKKRGWPKDEGISVQCHNCQFKQLALQRKSNGYCTTDPHAEGCDCK